MGGTPVSIVGAGLESLPTYWESAPEVWAVKHVTFALKEKGYKVHKSFWLDDINLTMNNWMNGVAQKLTIAWPYRESAMSLVLSDMPDWHCDKSHIMLYPFRSIIETFNTDFINNSGAMALAYAIWCIHKFKAYSEIHLHGFDYFMEEDKVNFQRSKELLRQAGCVHYWIGRAEALGIRVRVHPLSPTMDQKFHSRNGYKIRGVRADEVEKFHTTDKKIFAEWAANQALKENKPIPVSETPKPIPYEPLLFKDMDLQLPLVHFDLSEILGKKP